MEFTTNPPFAILEMKKRKGRVFMKRRILSILLLLSMLLTLLPAGVLAAGKTYGQIPIYLGYADVDYMAEEILKEIPTAGKSDREKIRAVYDWIIQHCSRYEWNGEYHFDEAAVVAQAEGAFYEKIVSAVEAAGLAIAMADQARS